MDYNPQLPVVSVALMGGLGNLMFQIATAMSVAKQYNYQLVVNNQQHFLPLAGHNINYYCDNVFRSIYFSDKIQIQHQYREHAYTYAPITNLLPNTQLLGYFQSEKYFEPQLVHDIFACTPENKKQLEAKYGDLSKRTAIHIRRGDYLKLQEYHAVMPMTYFEQAIAELGKPPLLVSSDDLPWCKAALANYDCIFIDEDEIDYLCMYAMSLSQNNIISNSSFSWWSAWLNTNEHKRVIAPSVWFGPKLAHDTKDLLPSEWQKI